MGNIPNGQVLLLQIENDRLRKENERIKRAEKLVDSMMKRGISLNQIERTALNVNNIDETVKKIDKTSSMIELVYERFITYLMQEYKIPDSELNLIDEFAEDYNRRKLKALKPLGRISKIIKERQKQGAFCVFEDEIDKIINEIKPTLTKQELELLNR